MECTVGNNNDLFIIGKKEIKHFNQNSRTNNPSKMTTKYCGIDFIIKKINMFLEKKNKNERMSFELFLKFAKNIMLTFYKKQETHNDTNPCAENDYNPILIRGR